MTKYELHVIILLQKDIYCTFDQVTCYKAKPNVTDVHTSINCVYQWHTITNPAANHC